MSFNVGTLWSLEMCAMIASTISFDSESEELDEDEEADPPEPLLSLA
jgi:hypothetical protein